MAESEHLDYKRLSPRQAVNRSLGEFAKDVAAFWSGRGGLIATFGRIRQRVAPDKSRAAGEHWAMTERWPPFEYETVRELGTNGGTEQYEHDRDIVAMHIGRYVIRWAQLDGRLNMVVAHWTGTHSSDPQHNKMGANTASAKVDMLGAEMAPDWRDGQAILRLVRAVNQYRNKLVHWGFGYAGHSDKHGQLGWHLSNPKKQFLVQVEPLTVESMRTEQAQLEVAERALLHLVSETFWDGSRIALTVDQLNAHSIGSVIVNLPGTWDTSSPTTTRSPGQSTRPSPYLPDR